MVYICVLNFENWADTIDCCDSLLKLDKISYHILLIDNNSKDDSRSRLQEYALHKSKEQITFLALTSNKGYAGGNNVGLHYALQKKDMNYCWILNNDTVVEPDALEKLVEFMQKNSDVGLCGSRLMYAWDRSRLQGYGGLYHYWTGESRCCHRIDQISDIDFVIGASVFVSRKFLETVGLMAEDYFLYFEEIDWATRAKGKFKISCCTDSVVYHKEGASIGTDRKDPKKDSMLSEYFNARNRILFTKKYYPSHIATVYLRILGKVYRRICWHQWKKAIMLLKLLIGVRDPKFETLVKAIH